MILKQRHWNNLSLNLILATFVRIEEDFFIIILFDILMKNVHRHLQCLYLHFYAQFDEVV